MRLFVLALIIGLAVGYHWGYGDASGGKNDVATRVLDHFGASKLRQENATTEKRIEDASKP
ncbi:MAG TPA: hypothetical protein VF159_12860 [Gemmatimonadaceae bacterium]